MITWKCQVCGFAIAHGEGYLIVRHQRLNQVAVDTHAWEEAHPDGSTMEDLASYPEDAKWEILHEACDPDPEDDGYCITVERVRSTEHLLRWTIHLMEKSWLENTNWSDVVRHVIGDRPL
jgi:hypothetical protein